MNTFAKTNILSMETSDSTFNQGYSKPSIAANAIKFGLYTSAAYILFSLLLWALDLQLIWWISMLGYVIIIGGIILAIRNYRDKLNNGFISFGNAFLTGFIVSILLAVISVFFSWVLMTYIDPGLGERILSMTEQTLIEKGLSDEMIEQQLQMQRSMMTGPMKFLGYIIGFVTTIAISTIISLICAAILKRNDDSFDSAFNQAQ